MIRWLKTNTAWLHNANFFVASGLDYYLITTSDKICGDMVKGKTFTSDEKIRDEEDKYWIFFFFRQTAWFIINIYDSIWTIHSILEENECWTCNSAIWKIAKVSTH